MIVERVESHALPARTLDEVGALCTEAYAEDFSRYFSDIGPGVHLLGRNERGLVAHAMWVTRDLHAEGLGPLRTAYVEAVATRVGEQRRGFGTQLLRRLAEEIQSFDVGALSPTDPAFYERLGWENWRGPLFVRTTSGVDASPDEAVMILRLPATPREINLDGTLSVDWRPGEVW